MPIYEYICLNCNLKFDYLVRSSQNPIICPGCKGKDLRRLVSSFAFSSKDKDGNIRGPSSSCSSCLSNNCSTCAK